MAILILGLVLFLGAHSVRIVADGWRGAQVARLGEMRWKGLYSIASAAGLVLIVVGYGQTRALPIDVWSPPVFTRHLAALLTIPAFVLLAAAYVPGNRLRRAVGHPMVLGVKIWAFAHLIANGRLGDIVLFGAFLAWAIADYASSRRRDRAAGVSRPAGTLAGDLVTTAVGLVAWAVFAFWLHAWLIGVAPMG